MNRSDPSPIARDDTLLGVCHALGEDFGFNPTYLRIVLAVLLLWKPLPVLAVYLGAGLLVGVACLLARFSFRRREEPTLEPAE